MSNTLAFESTFNICVHHFEFYTFGENHIFPYVEHVNMVTITLKSVKTSALLLQSLFLFSKFQTMPDKIIWQKQTVYS